MKVNSVVVQVFQHIYTLFVVIIGWVLFRSPGIKSAFSYVLAMLGFGTSEVYTALMAHWYLNNWGIFILVIAVLLSTPIIKKCAEKLKNNEAGELNHDFTYQYEDRFQEREPLINANAFIQYDAFENFVDPNYYLEKNKDIDYITPEILADYQHLDLRTDEKVEQIINYLKGKNYFTETNASGCKNRLRSI